MLPVDKIKPRLQSRHIRPPVGLRTNSNSPLSIPSFQSNRESHHCPNTQPPFTPPCHNLLECLHDYFFFLSKNSCSSFRTILKCHFPYKACLSTPKKAVATSSTSLHYLKNSSTLALNAQLF